MPTISWPSWNSGVRNSVPGSREQAKEMIKMAKRSVMKWFLGGLLLVIMATAMPGCKEEKEEVVQKETTEAGTPAEEHTYPDTALFEEEEGVEQESESDQDY
jgi:hypothetical protein